MNKKKAKHQPGLFFANGKVQGCLEWMAYSAALDSLVGGTGGHSCTHVVDVATLALRDVPGIDMVATPFPGGGIAVGGVPAAAAKVEKSRAF